MFQFLQNETMKLQDTRFLTPARLMGDIDLALLKAGINMVGPIWEKDVYRLSDYTTYMWTVANEGYLQDKQWVDWMKKYDFINADTELSLVAKK